MAKVTLFGRTISLERRDSVGNPSRWLTLAFGGGTDVAAGLRVNEAVAMRQRTVWSCVRIISGMAAQLPLPIYRRMPIGRERIDGHPLDVILNLRPNDQMTAFTFRQTLMSHLLTWGNAYAFIDRDNAGRVKSLWPLLPDRTQPQLNDEGKVVYLTRFKNDPNGISTSDNKQIVLAAEDVLHIPGLSFDGLKGYSVISQLREDIGLGLAMTEYAARFFGNGAVPGFVLQTENNLSPEQKSQLKAAWEEGHQGLINANRVAILERGLKVEKISIPPEDAQFLESRQYNKEEIAEIFGVPLHLLGSNDKTSGAWSGIEQLMIQFLQVTLNPIFTNWEQAVGTKLLSADDRDIFVKFLTADILRSDLKSRFEAYEKAFPKWMTANDIRRLEDLPPWPDDEGEVKALAPGQVPLSIALNPPAPAAPSFGGPSEPKFATVDVRKFIEPLLRNVLERTLKRERVDMVKTKKFDGVEIGAFLESNLRPIVEAFSGSIDGAWVETIVNKHVGDSLRLLDDGSDIGIEAAFGTSANRVDREIAAALATIPAPREIREDQEREDLNARQFAEAMAVFREALSRPTPPIQVHIDAPDAMATEVVYHTKGPLKGAVKGQRPVKELKD